MAPGVQAGSGSPLFETQPDVLVRSPILDGVYPPVDGGAEVTSTLDEQAGRLKTTRNRMVSRYKHDFRYNIAN